MSKKEKIWNAMSYIFWRFLRRGVISYFIITIIYLLLNPAFRNDILWIPICIAVYWSFGGFSGEHINKD